MKLRERVATPRRLGSGEALYQSESEVRFDPSRDVPADTWDKTLLIINEFGGPEDQGSHFHDLLYLAIIKPEVARAMHDPKLEQRLKDTMKKSWSNLSLQSVVSALRPVLRRADAAEVFPEFRQFELPSGISVQNLIDDLEGALWLQDLPFYTGLVFPRALMQLFPEHQAAIKKALEARWVKSKMEEMLDFYTRGGALQAMLFLGQAILVFPERAAEFKEMAEPFWPEVRQLLGPDQDSMGPAALASLIFSATLVGADKAQITPEGRLLIENKSTLGKARPLPERSVT